MYWIVISLLVAGLVFTINFLENNHIASILVCILIFIATIYTVGRYAVGGELKKIGKIGKNK